MTAILDRASPAYARGYRDCRDNRPKLFANDGTFYGYDYDEGWWACWNEHYWDAQTENKRRTAIFRYDLASPHDPRVILITDHDGKRSDVPRLGYVVVPR